MHFIAWFSFSAFSIDFKKTYFYIILNFVQLCVGVYTCTQVSAEARVAGLPGRWTSKWLTVSLLTWVLARFESPGRAVLALNHGSSLQPQHLLITGKMAVSWFQLTS